MTKARSMIMDMPKARKAMVDCQVRPNDVPNVLLQRAMEDLPREMFVPANRRSLAYIEKDVPLFDGRSLIQARDFSKLVHGLRLTEIDLVLDIGCGFGYSAAVMSRLASVVVGLEATAEVVSKATEICSDLGLDNVAMVEGDLSSGVPSQGPFDAILIAACVDDVPSVLFDQLKPSGGRLAAIVMDRGVGKATLFTRTGDSIGSRVLFEAATSAALPGFTREAAFQF